MHGDGDHAAKHDKFSLGKIYDARGVIDDVKADGHNGIDNAIGNAGKKVLKKKLRSHSKMLHNRKRGGEIM
jgi:hypothetical protein